MASTRGLQWFPETMNSALKTNTSPVTEDLAPPFGGSSLFVFGAGSMGREGENNHVSTLKMSTRYLDAHDILKQLWR